MNCKPGDLAVIVKGEYSNLNVGAIVSVIRRADDKDGLPAWLVTSNHPQYLIGSISKNESIGKTGRCADYRLQPIRPPRQQQSITTHEPAKESA